MMRQSSSPPQITTPLRFCLSCVATLACWLLWIALGIVLAAQLYIAAVREVPVPGFVLRRIESQLAAANLGVTFGAAHFSPTGALLLENVQLRSHAFDDPLLSSRLLFVRKSFWSMLAGQTVPDEIRLEGATLQLPAPLSPSGLAVPLVRDAAVTLQHEGASPWQLEQFTGRIGELTVTAQGEIPLPRRPRKKSVTASLEEITAQYLRFGRQLALQLPRLDACEHPTLNVQLSPGVRGGVQVAARFATAALHRPLGHPIETGPLFAEGEWLWDPTADSPAQFSLGAASVECADVLAADRVHATVAFKSAADFSTVHDVLVQLGAAEIRACGETAASPTVVATLEPSTHRAEAQAAFATHGEVLSVRAAAALDTKSAEIAFSGRVPPPLVTSVLARYAPKIEPYLRFGDPVQAEATATLAPGWHFTRLDSRVHGGRLDSHGVAVTAFRGRIELDAALNFLAHDALLIAGENFARGSYGMNFRSHDYRVLLTGRLRPPDIAGWFRGPWWLNFWEHFSFPAVPPSADVDVDGNFANVAKTRYFGSTDASQPVVLGADFERAQVRVFVRPHFAHVFDLQTTRAHGAQNARGWFKRFADPQERSHPRALEYDLQGNLDAETERRLGGAVAEKLLAMWRFVQPPDVHFWGRTDFEDDQAVNHLQFTGKAANAAFYLFPFEQLAVKGSDNADQLQLDQVDFQTVGGQGSAKVTLDGPDSARRIKIEAKVKEADFARTVLAIEQFEADRTGGKTGKLAESKFIKRASGGKLDLSLVAQGSPGDLASLRGSGAIQLTGAELGEIHLFGLLSQVLSAIWLNFSSLKLDSARSTFTLEDGRVHFPDVKVSGPSAVIDAKGDYLLKEKTVDFSARLKPYEESRNPITQVVGIVINPLTSIFELRLSGPIAKPSWSLFGQKSNKPAEAGGPAPETATNVPTDPAATPPAATKKSE